MPHFAIFVLDSVLFDSRHRQHLVSSYKDKGGDANTSSWDEYWQRCLSDTPLPALVTAASLLNAGVRLVLTSGRPANLLEKTRVKFNAEMVNLGVDQDKLNNVQFDLRVPGENYTDKVRQLVEGLKREDGNLVLALIKNNGLTSSLRRAWPLATVCNVAR